MRRSTDNPFVSEPTILSKIFKLFGLSASAVMGLIVSIVLIVGVLMATGIIQVK